MSGHQHTTTLTPAEQAIARYGSVTSAAQNTDVPLKELARAWRQMAAAASEPARRGETPRRHIRIPDDLWDQLTTAAGPRGRSAFVLAAVRKALESP